MNRHLAASLTTIVSVLCIASAQAVSVNIKFNSPTGSYHSILALDNPAGSYYLGLYNLSVDASPITGVADQSFNAFCIDPFQSAPTHWTQYDAVAFSTLSGDSDYTNVLKLYDNAYADMVNLANPGGLTKAQYATAFHLALWEIWKGNNPFDLNLNPVNVQGSVDSAVELKAQGFLDNLSTWQVTGSYSPNKMVAFVNSSQQDFLAIGVAAVPVPEADTYAFIAIGMGLVGLLARRRSASSAT